MDMINIPLDDNYRIASDAHQFMIQKKFNTKDRRTGEPAIQWNSMSFHSNLESLLRELWRQEVLCSAASSMEELKQSMSNASHKLSELMRGYGFNIIIVG